LDTLSENDKFVTLYYLIIHDHCQYVAIHLVSNGFYEYSKYQPYLNLIRSTWSTTYQSCAIPFSKKMALMIRPTLD